MNRRFWVPELRARFDRMATTVYRMADPDAAAGAYDDLVATLHHAADGAAAEHLRVAHPDDVFHRSGGGPAPLR